MAGVEPAASVTTTTAARATSDTAAAGGGGGGETGLGGQTGSSRPDGGKYAGQAARLEAAVAAARMLGDNRNVTHQPRRAHRVECRVASNRVE